jgi:hypothetical protein
MDANWTSGIIALSASSLSPWSAPALPVHGSPGASLGRRSGARRTNNPAIFAIRLLRAPLPPSWAIRPETS